MSKQKTPLTSYQKRLFVFLSVATFFEGFDFMALTQILPNLRETYGLSESDGGDLVAFINAGTVLAYFLIRKADTWGRRRLMVVTIIGYTLCTLASGFAPTAQVFGICQLGARIFLIAEWATAMIYAAEEYPADRRGMVMGVIQGFNAAGAIICAGIVPMMLNTDVGWRGLYFVGAVPLVIIAFARRNLRETERFKNRDKTAAKSGRSIFYIMKTPYRNRVFQLAAIWGLTYVCTHNAVTFFKEFCLAERNLTDGDVAGMITIAALGSMPLIFMVGKLLDMMGRRRGAIVIYLLSCTGVYLSYTLHTKTGLTLALVFGIFGASAVLPVLNTFTTELFPTHLRSDAFAWSNNLLGRIGYVLPPIIIGRLAEIYGWGPTMSITPLFPLIGLGLILFWLPETVGKELEETSAIDAGP